MDEIKFAVAEGGCPNSIELCGIGRKVDPLTSLT